MDDNRKYIKQKKLVNKLQTWCGILLGAYTGIFPSEWVGGCFLFKGATGYAPLCWGLKPLKNHGFQWYSVGWASMPPPRVHLWNRPHYSYFLITKNFCKQEKSKQRREIFMNYSSMFSFYTISKSKIFFYQGRFRQK